MTKTQVDRAIIHYDCIFKSVMIVELRVWGHLRPLLLSHFI